MFKDCGKKIKIVASVWFWLIAIGSFIGAIVLWTEGDDVLIGIGFGTLFAGILFAFVSALLIYGFGQLIENSDKIADSIQNGKGKKSAPKTSAPLVRLTAATYEESEEGDESEEDTEEDTEDDSDDSDDEGWEY